MKNNTEFAEYLNYSKSALSKKKRCVFLLTNSLEQTIGGSMEFNDIHIGMKCGSKKGSGTVTWIDGSTRTIYMANTDNNNSFEVNFEEIIEDPQAHNKEDTYY